jgi:hypothetical protein
MRPKIFGKNTKIWGLGPQFSKCEENNFFQKLGAYAQFSKCAQKF